MTKNIRTIYLYLVSFITLGMMVMGIIYFVNSISNYAFPTVHSYYDYREDKDFKHNDEYIKSLNKEKRKALRNTISSVAVVAVAAPLYAYHSKKIAQEKEG